MHKLILFFLFFAVVLVQQGAAKRLDSLIIDGLVINQEAVVRNSAGFKKGQDFTGSDVQEAIKNLYRLGLFSDITFYAINETDTSVTLVVDLQEYPVCEAIEFSGNKKIKTRELEEQIDIRLGRVLNDAILAENVKIIRDFYAEKGYLLVKIESELIETKIPGNAILRVTINEGDKVRIKEISIEGAVSFSERKLKRKFKTKENRWWRSGEYDDDLYASHLDSLMLFYYDEGYLDAAILSDSVWFDDNGKDIYIDIKIEEGTQYFVGDFYFSGNTVLEADSLKEKIALRKGRPFEKTKFDMTKYLVEDAYREEGYLWVQVKDERTYRKDTIDVTFEITEGRAAVVRKIIVNGNTKTRDKVIRREIRLIPGQKYRQSKMTRSARDLMQLGYFNDVKPDLKPNLDGTIDLSFDVDEKDNIGQLSIGAAFSERDGLGGTFSTAIPNFRGAGQELKLDIIYGRTNQNYAISFIEPWAFELPKALWLRGSVNYTYTKFARGQHTENYGFSLGAGTRLSWPDDYFSIRGAYEFSQTNTSYPDEVSLDKTVSVPGDGLLSSISFTLRRNDTDIPLFPNSGSDFYVTPTIAGLGGDYKYLKATAGYDWYFPLWWKVVFGLKAKFGIIEPLFGNDQIVINRFGMFYAGGIGPYTDVTIRGFPQIYGYSEIRDVGRDMLNFSALLQVPILEQQLYLALFADMGNTWADLRDIDLNDTYKGAGIGARLNVPMLGLMGFDFGWSLDWPDSYDADHDRWKFHFVMQQGF